MITAKHGYRSGELTGKLERRAHSIATAIAERKRLAIHNDGSQWRSPRLLWPHLF